MLIADPTKSWAYYGRLADGQSDTYAFSTTTPITIPWQLLIERNDSSGAIISQLNMRSDRTQVFFEPFSHLNYVATIAKSVLLRPGAHRLTVVMKGTGNEQRYVLALGEQERFSVGEIPYVLGAIHRVQVRGY